MAQDFPEDKYDFKVQKDERTFAQNLLHAAALDFVLTEGFRIKFRARLRRGRQSFTQCFQDKSRRGEVRAGGRRGRGASDSTAGRRGAGQYIEILREPTGPQRLHLDVRHRVQRRALWPACGLLSCEQPSATGLAALMR